MIHRLVREALLIIALVGTIVAVLAAGRALQMDEREEDGGAAVSGSRDGGAAGAQPARAATSNQGPVVLPWQPTGTYRVVNAGIGLTVHAFRVTPGSTTILYTVDSGPGSGEVNATSIALEDEQGKGYPAIESSTLGTSLGVTAAILTVRLTSEASSELRLVMREVRVGTDSIKGTWTLAFVKNVDPGTGEGYYLSGRISPEVMTAGDVKVALASGPGSEFIRLLVARGDEQGAIYGYASEGLGRPVTEAEWKALFFEKHGYADPGLPAGWPALAGAE